jgi:hypothetical protein
LAGDETGGTRGIWAQRLPDGLQLLVAGVELGHACNG